MSYKVIRLAGSHADNHNSINNFADYIKDRSRPVFIIISAYPDIQNTILKSFDNISNIDSNNIEQHLNNSFFKCCRTNSSEAFRDMANQVAEVLRGIKLTQDYSSGLKDKVLSYGERLTAEIVYSLLKEELPEIKILLPEELKFEVTDEFGNATYTAIDHEAVDTLKSKINIVPGSYGVTPQQKISRVGIDAADYTAAWLTSEIKADALELWDINKRFFKADPNIIQNPSQIKRLTYSEASELAYFDHYTLHPRTVEPIEEVHIPIKILNSNVPAGECITTINTESFVEPQIVKSIATSDNIALLQIDGPGVGLKPGILSKVTSILSDSEINIRSVITSQISIRLILETADGEKALKLIRKFSLPFVKNISLADNLSLIGIIGHGLGENYGLSATIMSAIAEEGINLILSGSGASELSTYLVIDRADKARCVKSLYSAFFEDNLKEKSLLSSKLNKSKQIKVNETSMQNL